MVEFLFDERPLKRATYLMNYVTSNGIEEIADPCEFKMFAFKGQRFMLFHFPSLKSV